MSSESRTPSPTYVLRDRRTGKYLAATVFSKFNYVSEGDLVPEQLYACRWYDRNTVAAVALRATPPYRIVRLFKKASTT